MANTKSREVNLTKRVQAGNGLRYCPVVLSANGRVKPDWATVLPTTLAIESPTSGARVALLCSP